MMDFVTDFADQAVVLPVVAVVLALLALQGWYRGAVAWLVAVAGTFGMVFILKVGFLACAPVFGPVGLSSPSGHAAAATVLSGGLAALMTARTAIVLAAALLAGAVIGTTRLALGVHSWPEVVMAIAIGLVGVFALTRLAGTRPALRPRPIMAGVVFMVVLLHGARLPAEVAIRSLAHRIAGFVPICREPTMSGSLAGRMMLAWDGQSGWRSEEPLAADENPCPADQTLP